MAFLLNGNPLAVDVAFSHNDIQYPANWLRLSTAQEKKDLGITEVADAPVFDGRFYNGDGSAKALDDIDAKDEEGNLKYGTDAIVTYYGAINADQRQENIKKFQDSNSKVRFFIGNPQTGGYGITLTEAKAVIYYSNSYDLEKRLQSEDRAHRIGQKNKVTYIDMMADDTVDEKIVESLRNKVNIATEIMGEDLREWI